MLSLEDYETIFLLVSLAGSLLLASPALAFVFSGRGGERFSEVYVLGPNRMAEGYPFNVRVNESYRVYLGVGDHLGSSAYYVLFVKFRNQSDSLPDSVSGLPSSLPGLFGFRVFLVDGGVWEAPLDFSFVGVSGLGNSCFVESLVLNGLVVSVNKTGVWDSVNGGFFFELFFELWVYDVESMSFGYDGRFVGFWVNVTV